MRLGWGEYFRPETADQDLSDFVQWHARLQFIEAAEEVSSISNATINDIYPRFLLLVEDVANFKVGKKRIYIPNGWSASDALQTIRSWEAILNYLGEPLPEIRPLNQDEKIQNEHPNLNSFMEYIKKNTENNWGFWLAYIARGIQTWAAIFNLQDAKWFYEMVIVLFWRKALKDKESWAIPGQYINAAINMSPPPNLPEEKQSEAKRASNNLNNEKRISFEVRHWHPLLETRKAAKSRMLKAFAEHIRKEFDRRESLCQNAGLLRTPEKRNQEHFKWLAYYLLKGWDYETIAQHYMNSDPKGELDIGTDAVRKALKNTADLIGVELRK